jgi:hypothetical protein
MMRKVLALAILSTFTIGAAYSQKFTYTGVMKLEFGRGYDANGQPVNFAGLYVPYVAEYLGPNVGKNPFQIKKKWQSRKPDGGFHGGGPDGGGEDAPVVYSNDNGDGTYMVSSEEYPMPSCLDDMGLTSAGANQPWKTMTIGMDILNEERFLIRWKIYYEYVPGRGPDITAFDPDPPAAHRDFGGYFTPPLAGTYKVTFNVAGVGCRVPGTELYMAQQFREPTFPEFGEGAFKEGEVQSVFSGGNPSVGSSQPHFWYDWDPINGIYDETEVEIFGTDPGQESNFLFTLTAGGNVETVNPISFTILPGFHRGGNLGSLWNSDNNRLLIENAAPFSPTAPAIQLEVVGGVGPGGTIMGFDFTWEGHGQFAVPQEIRLFNYTQNAWVTVDARPAPMQDLVIIHLDPNTANQFISGNGQVKARMLWYEMGGLPAASWQVRVDQAVWHINRSS